MSNLKAGVRLHNQIPIPTNAVVYKSELGREFYVSSTTENGATIRFLDGEKEIKEITTSQAEKYRPFTFEPETTAPPIVKEKKVTPNSQKSLYFPM